MDVNVAANKIINLINEIKKQHPESRIEYHQQDVIKKNMCVKGCNGRLWIQPHLDWYDISLSGQSLTKEMEGFMIASFGSKHGNKQSKPEPGHQPFWRVRDFESVVLAVYRYAGLARIK